MSTYSKNLHFLKEALFAKLNNDATLRGLLGGSGRIFHRDTPQEPTYPCIIYAIIDDRDNPYNETCIDGQITRCNFRITIFNNN